MFFAHSAAGYLLTKPLVHRLTSDSRQMKQLLVLGMIGSVFPDLDLLYFYLIDQQQHAHHTYWTHLPYFWLVLFALAMSVAAIFNARTIAYSVVIFTLNVCLHLFLDTFCGGIRWFYPFEPTKVVFFEVPARFDWWVMNFILHWSFVVELLIMVAAIQYFRKTKTAVAGLRGAKAIKAFYTYLLTR
jgi:inner membrane protein